MPPCVVHLLLLVPGINAANAASSLNATRTLQIAQVELEQGSRRVVHVGPGREFLLPSAAAKVARDGDIIEIDAGTYEKDATAWRQHNLTIRGIGGKALWVIKGNTTTVENIEFSGARATHRNGAGIRHAGAGLLIRHCYFYDNENGILTGSVPKTTSS